MSREFHDLLLEIFNGVKALSHFIFEYLESFGSHWVSAMQNRKIQAYHVSCEQQVKHSRQQTIALSVDFEHAFCILLEELLLQGFNSCPDFLRFVGAA